MTNTPPEKLDVAEVVSRWDEIIDRTEAGEIFIISEGGEPRARLEPIPSESKPSDG